MRSSSCEARRWEAGDLHADAAARIADEALVADDGRAAALPARADVGFGGLAGAGIAVVTSVAFIGRLLRTFAGFSADAAIALVARTGAVDRRSGLATDIRIAGLGAVAAQAVVAAEIVLAEHASTGVRIAEGA